MDRFAWTLRRSIRHIQVRFRKRARGERPFSPTDLITPSKEGFISLSPRAWDEVRYYELEMESVGQWKTLGVCYWLRPMHDDV